ncbi:MAG TPA: metallophosphoesterase, partial [Nitrososphaeraceae archaeon]|nr:metallophosphoesterase [Nitrososphaeraceae archaeon]
VNEFDNLIILVLGTAGPDRDEGEVGHRQNIWMEEVLRKHKKKRKIVVIHHHLISIPDTGYANVIGARPGFVWSQA